MKKGTYKGTGRRRSKDKNDVPSRAVLKAVSATSHDPEKEDQDVYRIDRPWIIDLIYQKANDIGINVSELTSRMGFGQGYLFQLKAKPEKCARLSFETIRKFADFLETSPIHVMAASGMLTAEDFFLPKSKLTFKHDLERAARFIADDPEWAFFVPRPVETIKPSLLLMLVYAYQRTTGRTLIKMVDPAVDVISVIGG